MFKNFNPGAIQLKCSWREGLDLAQQAGFAGADLNLEEALYLAEEQGAAAVRREYHRRGLRLGGWGLPVNWRGTEVQFHEGLARLPAAAQLAAEVGCRRVTTVVPGWHDELPRKPHFDQAVRRLRVVAEILKHYGHSLGLEFIGPRTSRAARRYGFAYSMDGMLMLCCAIGTGNVGLLFDVWHWYTAQSTLDDVRQLAKEDVVYIHLNDAPLGIEVGEQIDNQRCLPGETGIIPARELLAILVGLGYDGPVTAEPFNQRVREAGERTPLEAARMVSAAMDGVWEWGS